jgi:transposase InsO family protein
VAAVGRDLKAPRNAKAERFMRTLKDEEVNGKPYASIDEARAHIGAFLETAYNLGRLRSALGYEPRSSSKPNSAASKPSERTQTKAFQSNAVSQSRGAVHPTACSTSTPPSQCTLKMPARFQASRSPAVT